MKFGSVTKPNKRNKTMLKKFDGDVNIYLLFILVRLDIYGRAIKGSIFNRLFIL